MNATSPDPQPKRETDADDASAADQFSEGQPTRFAPAVAAPAVPRIFVMPDVDGFDVLRLWAETFEDHQDHRKRMMNRLGYKADGTEQTTGARIPRDQFAGQADLIGQAEHIAALAMRRCYRRVAPPGVIAWQKGTFGIGEHLLSRLLGSLGHPRIATPHHWEGEGKDRKLIADQPFERTLRQLWSYCGHGDPERQKRKGMSAEEAFRLGSPRCKMLVHLLAEASMKCRVEPIPAANAETTPADPTSPGAPTVEATATQHSARQGSSAGQPTRCSKAKVEPADRRYRVIYEARRAHTAETHADWTDGHSHNDALHIVGKEILRDLWVAAG